MSDENGAVASRVLHFDEARVMGLGDLAVGGAEELTLGRKVKKAPGLGAFLDRSPGLRILRLHHPSLLKQRPAACSIEELEITGGSLGNLDFLAGFPALRRLTLSSRGTEVSDLTALRHVPDLERLRATGHRAGTLKPLRALARLEEYFAPKTKALASLDGLDGCPELLHVDANQSRIAKVDPLAGATKLRALNIRGTKVAALDPLYGCLSLETLFAERTKVRTIDGIAEGLPGLRLLWLHNTAVTDLEPLVGLRSLLELDIGGLAIDGFAFLGELPSLRHVDLHGTRFSDLSILESLPNLVSARLTDTKVRRNDPRVAKLNRRLVSKHGREAGLSFEARSGIPRLSPRHAACADGSLD